MNNDKVGGNILIVDDTLDNLRLLSQMLTERGHPVRAAKSGWEALASIQAAKPDLVLLDIKLPDLSGYEVCARLKADAATCVVPIIFISALDETEDKLRAFKVGGVDYITKPFYEDEVLARVKTHLEMSRLRRDLARRADDLRLSNERLTLEMAERKRVAERLEVANRQTRIILESISDAFFSLDDDLVVTYFNPAAEKALGRQRDDVVGRKLFESFPEAAGSIFEEQYRRGVKERVHLSFETYFGIAPYENWYDVRVYPHADGIAVYFQLITERKLAEVSLRREKELFVDLIRSMPSGVYRVRIFSPETWKKNAWSSSANAPYSMELVSDRFCDILGVSKETYSKNPGILNDLVHPEDKAVFAKVHEDAMSSLNRFSWDGRIVKDGEIRWMHFESLPRALENGDVIWTGSVQDTTDRKKAEEALRESEEFARRVIDSSNDCIKVLDLEGHLLSMSEGGQKLLEIDDIALYLNKSWIDFWKDKDREGALAAISKAKGGDAGIFYGFCETAKGTPKWWEVIVSPIKDARGNVDRLLALSRDVTERERADVALAESEKKLRALFETMSEGIVYEDNDGKIISANACLLYTSPSPRDS